MQGDQHIELVNEVPLGRLRCLIDFAGAVRRCDTLQNVFLPTPRAMSASFADLEEFLLGWIANLL